MDFLKDYHFLIFIIGIFLFLVTVLPYSMHEIKKRRELNKLSNRIVPLSSLDNNDLKKIVTHHSSGKKVHPSINRSRCVGCGTCVLTCRQKGALAVIEGKSTLVDPFLCEGWGDCALSCPTGANQIIEYGEKKTQSVPEVDENHESNIEDVFVIGSLAGAALIKEAINEGRSVVNHIMKDVYPDELPRIVVIGSGPAGLSAVLSCKKFGLPVECIEKEATANTIQNFPKRKILMAEPVDMPLFGPLWVGDTTREKLLDVWSRILEKTGVDVQVGLKLEHIQRQGKKLVVHASGQEIPCDKVILALGTRGEPRKLCIPGENLPHVFYRLLDAGEFARRNVAIVGAGDSAIEASLALLSQDCRVALIVRGGGFPKAKTANREKIEGARQNERLKIYFNSHTKSIKKSSIEIQMKGRDLEIPAEFVFVLIGGELPHRILEKIGIRIVEREM